MSFSSTSPGLGARNLLRVSRPLHLVHGTQPGGILVSVSCPLHTGFRARSKEARGLAVVASLKPPSGKGFGKKKTVEKRSSPESLEVPGSSSASSSRSPTQGEGRGRLQSSSVQQEDDDDVVPEVVTNRMLKRIAVTVGFPLAFGVLLFPTFYYLKMVTKLDVPEWLPLVVSMVTFGTAGFGITYGIVSTSWDPAREGSLLGWKEARVNWPLIWDKVQGSKEQR